MERGAVRNAFLLHNWTCFLFPVLASKRLLPPERTGRSLQVKIRILKVGRPKTQEARSLAEEYQKRLRPFVSIECLELKPKQVLPEGHLIVLDERGKEWTSHELSTQVRKWMDNPQIKILNFLIGGPYGIDETTRDDAFAIWSLAKGTLPSDLAWIVASEQLYRAFTILKGMPYHHE